MLKQHCTEQIVEGESSGRGGEMECRTIIVNGHPDVECNGCYDPEVTSKSCQLLKFLIENFDIRSPVWRHRSEKDLFLYLHVTDSRLDLEPGEWTISDHGGYPKAWRDPQAEGLAPLGELMWEVRCQACENANNYDETCALHGENCPRDKYGGFRTPLTLTYETLPRCKRSKWRWQVPALQLRSSQVAQARTDS